MKQPLAILITDTHLSESTVDLNFKIYSQVLSLAGSLGVSTIFHGGDVFTSRKGQPEIVLNSFKSILDLFQQEGFKLIAIPGNHDKTSYVGTSSYLDAFTSHPALTVLQTGGVMIEGAIAFHFIPYFDEKLTYPKYIPKDTDSNLFNILITHCAINGVKTNSGVVVGNELPQDLFDKFDLVLVGHYHDRQVISPKIVYVGSTYQANFGEDEHKGCTVLYDDGSYEFIDLEFTKYITVKYKAEEINNKVIKEALKLKGVNNLRVKVIGKLEPEQTQLVEQLSNSGIRLELSKTEVSAIDVSQAQTQFTSQDILDVYDEWAVEKKIEDSQVGKQLLIKVL